MIEKTFVKRSGKRYWAWICFLLVIIAVGCAAYGYQMTQGFQVTGLSRDISWGLYISHLAFFVGIGAGSAMVILPYYFHNVKEYGRITVLAQFLAVTTALMGLLFVVVDVGVPQKMLNVWLYWLPSSMLCWDAVVIPLYLVISFIVGYQVLQAENKGLPIKKWVKGLALLSVPSAFAVSIVSAFLYAGLPSRHYFLSAVLPVKFLAGAFAGGPALIILICLLLKRLTDFHVSEKALRMLATTATYAFIALLIMVAGEFFTAYYSNVPAHKVTLTYLFFGLDGKSQWVPFLTVFWITAAFALVLMLPKKFRYNYATMGVGAASMFIALYLEKGLTFIVGGLSENPFGEIVSYIPGLAEILIIIGIFAIGILVFSLLVKMVLVVKYEQDEEAFPHKYDRGQLAYDLNRRGGTYVDTRPRYVPEPEASDDAEDTDEKEAE
ncbi:MAG: NrfD/PsrC family molybdoenzyme membrane anchor subunit [Clostridiales bacterium]|nr:NrfD/PsrC family molybdoenzyme membrane anchor subunit [Clostridiales bacterium]